MAGMKTVADLRIAAMRMRGMEAAAGSPSALHKSGI
jgi:hypothetical protein